MGANPTQAQGITLFLIAFTLIATGFAAGGSVMYLLGGVALLVVACAIFMKCKPWEHRED